MTYLLKVYFIDSMCSLTMSTLAVYYTHQPVFSMKKRVKKHSYEKGYINIGSHNIQGGADRKFEFNDVRDFIRKHDICLFQETGQTVQDLSKLDYQVYRSERKKKKKSSVTGGGVSVIFKSYLKKGLHKITSKNDDFLWIKMDKSFFGFKKDIYLCNCYIPPENSPRHKEADEAYFDTLRHEIAKYSTMGEILLYGDVNSRTGTLQEKYQSIEKDFALGANDLIDIDTRDKIACETNFGRRLNKDETINSFGTKLIHLTEQCQLTIVNGRKIGDTCGKKTCFKYNGSSKPDYCITSFDIFNDILNMRVLEKPWYSDHCPITSTLKSSIVHNNIDENYHDKLENLYKFVWNEQTKHEYMNIVQNDIEYKEKLEKYCCTKFNSTDEATEELTKIIFEVAKKSIPIKQIKVSQIQYDNDEDEFNNLDKDSIKTLKEGKREFNYHRREFDANKSCMDRRHRFIIARSKYRKLKYLMYNTQKHNRLIELARLESSDPKAFWGGVKKLTSIKHKQNPNINPDNWVQYFTKLLNVTKVTKNSFIEYVENSIPVIEKCDSHNEELNGVITPQELKSVMKNLKNGKAAGPDMIYNELIKFGGDLFHNALLHLYNHILSSGLYPHNWKLSIITPIHKKSDIHDPSNYRGIAVADCMSKLFCKILNERLINFLKLKNIWSINQNGFMEKRRTDDNIFILHTLFQKYVSIGKGKLYLAFVDFSKFFDCLNRKVLLYKLLKCGISGNVYNVIKSAYEGSRYCVKTNGGLTKEFVSSTGVKQGCTLSPTLSNIYQNDIHNIFDEKCDPVKLDNYTLNSMSWADDLVLISNSQKGLQRCLDSLHNYCEKWELSINSEKTKCMIMSKKSNDLCDDFTLNNVELETVKKYKYLGLIISNNGSLHNMAEDRVSKAKRALFMAKQAISTTHNVSVQLAMSIFDKQISPILLYGSVNWGFPDCNSYVRIKGTDFKKKCKDKVKSLLKHLDMDDKCIVLCRYCKSNDDVLVKLDNVMSKIVFMEKFNKFPVSFHLSENENTSVNNYEKVHTNFCKHSLGISKYESTTLSLGELGRYPIQNKIIVQTIAYWARMEQGSENILLNKAFSEMKTEKYKWLENIKYFLYSNGMRDIWSNVQNLSIHDIKRRMSRYLEDKYIQKYHSYIVSNHEKASVTAMCNNINSVYKRQEYLDIISNPEIRNYFTRLRIDCNKTSDCRKRSFRFKQVTDDTCTFCNSKEQQTVAHILLNCNGTELKDNRNLFIKKLSPYVKDLMNINDNVKLKMILRLQPNCKDLDKEKSINIIINYVRKIYSYI